MWYVDFQVQVLQEENKDPRFSLHHLIRIFGATERKSLASTCIQDASHATSVDSNKMWNLLECFSLRYVIIIVRGKNRMCIPLFVYFPQYISYDPQWSTHFVFFFKAVISFASQSTTLSGLWVIYSIWKFYDVRKFFIHFSFFIFSQHKWSSDAAEIAGQTVIKIVSGWMNEIY